MSGSSFTSLVFTEITIQERLNRREVENCNICKERHKGINFKTLYKIHRQTGYSIDGQYTQSFVNFTPTTLPL